MDSEISKKQKDINLPKFVNSLKYGYQRRSRKLKTHKSLRRFSEPGLWQDELPVKK
jgi:hypothetical protein